MTLTEQIQEARDIDKRCQEYVLAHMLEAKHVVNHETASQLDDERYVERSLLGDDDR